MSELKRVEKCVIVGASGKDIGKTTLITNIIRHIKSISDDKIYGIKSTIFHGDAKFDNYSILKEDNMSGKTDTSRMLLSGCEEVYWLKTDMESVEKGFLEILEKIPLESIIICESNTLRNFVIPDLFILLADEDQTNWKKSALNILDKADLVINIDRNSELNLPEVSTFLTLDKTKFSLIG
ncbi:MAG: hypothetical protein JXR48_10955 [Candidatus Delongbacteria bacterium]|nr:hypothetical protein [Candidatus Delongbacteria bacterium]MBN2835471.1 hypothetical protein [Candidatus Delongbacteria bacterium]